MKKVANRRTQSRAQITARYIRADRLIQAGYNLRGLAAVEFVKAHSPHRIGDVIRFRRNERCVYGRVTLVRAEMLDGKLGICFNVRHCRADGTSMRSSGMWWGVHESCLAPKP